MLKITEEDLIKELANGSLNREIAVRYGMTLQGVKQRLYVLYKKHGVKNRIQFLNKINLKEERCPYCGSSEFFVEHEDSEDLSFRRECCCSKCEKYFVLNYDLKLTDVTPQR